MSDIISKVLANLSRSTDQQTGAGSGPLTQRQAMAAEAKAIGDRLDRLQGKIDAAQADEDETDLPIRERFHRQVKRNAAKK
jgi:hypothetical protein